MVSLIQRIYLLNAHAWEVPLTTTPLYIYIAETISARIKTGQYSDRLPTESELADQFESSVPTVKKALSRLVDDGIIRRIPGKGTFVQNPQSSKANAKSMATRDERTNEEQPPLIVGVIIPHIDTVSDRLISGIASGLAERNAYPLIGLSHGHQENESKLIHEFLLASVEGFIMFPVEGELYNADIVRLTLQRFPIVLVDRWLRGIDVSRVVAEHAKGIEQAVNYLYGLGHRNIVLLSMASDHPESTQSILERKLGFEQSVRALGLKSEDNIWVTPRPKNDNMDDMVQRMVQKLGGHGTITAMICVSKTDTLLAHEAVRRLGMSVPEDISIIGFDIGNDTRGLEPLFAHRNEVSPVAWLDQSEDLIGQEAASLIYRLIQSPGQTEVIEIPVILRTGATCSRPKN